MFREGLANLVNENDARKALFTQENAATNDDPMGYYLTKYMQVIGDNSHTGNVRVIRLTEAKFIKWEAMAKLGQDAAVLAELNEFAAERGGSEYTGDALTAVLAEKRIEFAGEGLRFFDLKRNNLGFDKVTNIRGNANPVTADSKLFVLPIPSSSLNLNKLITQYPGWYN